MPRSKKQKQVHRVPEHHVGVLRNPESLARQDNPIKIAIGKFYVPSEKDKELVWILSAAGVSHDRIAKYFGISEPLLVKHFRHELTNADTEAIGAVANALYQNAVFKGDTTAQIFWLKTRARWREANRLELTGADGGPIAETRRIDFGKLSVQELLRLEELMKKAALPEPQTLDAVPD